MSLLNDNWVFGVLAVTFFFYARLGQRKFLYTYVLYEGYPDGGRKVGYFTLACVASTLSLTCFGIAFGLIQVPVS